MKKAFTMVELIFVIVIIGILAAVAIPKLAGTRDDAKISAMVENARKALGDIQAYYYAQSNVVWRTATVDQATNVSFDETNCGNPVTSTTQLSPTTFILCHDNVICVSFETIDEGNLTIADGTVTTDPICEVVKAEEAIIAISNQEYQLGGKKVER